MFSLKILIILIKNGIHLNERNISDAVILKVSIVFFSRKNFTM